MATVLVVEDNPANMTLATFLLKSAGYAVLSATDAEAGLSLARTEQPDLVLMDIQLPGMDGLEACAILKKSEATRDIPVIALTALAMKGERRAHSRRRMRWLYRQTAGVSRIPCDDRGSPPENRGLA